MTDDESGARLPVVDESAPSPEEMAAYLGEPEESAGENAKPNLREGPVPSLEEAEARIPAKAKALMDELFRARFEKVKRIDPDQVR